MNPVLEICTGLLVNLYGALFLAGWNFYFPSRMEQTLWRTTSIITLAFGSLATTSVLYCIHFMLPRWRDRRTALKVKLVPSQGASHETRKIQRWMEGLRNVSSEGDPARSIPLRMLLPLTILGTVYIASRICILVEDGIGLRKLPSSAFQTVAWSQFIPHF